MPQVPCIRWCTRNDIDPFLQRIESLLVFPLPVVHARRSAPTAVQGKIQAPSIGRFVTEMPVKKRHFHFAVRQYPGFHLRSPFFLQPGPAVSGQQAACSNCIRFRQRHGCKWLFVDC